MAGRWTPVLFAALTILGRCHSRPSLSVEDVSAEVQTEAVAATEAAAESGPAIDLPRLLLQIVEGKGFNLSIPSK